MKIQIRTSTFETNSSSIHALAVAKDAPMANYDDLELIIKPWTHEAVGYDSTILIKTVEEKLQYLWTFRCLMNSYRWADVNGFITTFTIILKTIFPKCTFVETEDVAYLEDVECLIEEDLMLDESFLRRLIGSGEIHFTTRDGDYDDPVYENYIQNLRSRLEYPTSAIKEVMDILWSEG